MDVAAREILLVGPDPVRAFSSIGQTPFQCVPDQVDQASCQGVKSFKLYVAFPRHGWTTNQIAGIRVTPGADGKAR